MRLLLITGTRTRVASEIADALREASYDVLGAPSHLLSLREIYQVDAVVVDLASLREGAASLRTIRRCFDGPVVALGGGHRAAAALDLGADAVTPRPRDSATRAILLAQLRATSRRSEHRRHAPGHLELGDVRVALPAGPVTRAGHPIPLPPHEMRLLVELLQEPDRAVPAERLAARWGTTFEGVLLTASRLDARLVAAGTKTSVIEIDQDGGLRLAAVPMARAA